MTYFVISRREIGEEEILNKRCNDLYYEVTPPGLCENGGIGKDDDI